MKPILVTIAFLANFSIVRAQQPAPKTPKDPDSAVVIKMSVVPDAQNAIDANKIYTAVERDPEFPGGMPAFYKYLGENVHYPVNAKKKNIQGKVFISFVIEKDGSLTDIKIIRGLSPDIDAEAVRVFKICPKWNPGIQKGKPVRVQYNVPLSFSLK